MDAVEIGGDGRGMASAAASVAHSYKTVEIPKDGWCLYNALLEAFSPPISLLGTADRTAYARMFAYILGQYMIDWINDPSGGFDNVVIDHNLGGDIVDISGSLTGKKGYYTYEIAEDEFGRKTQECIVYEGRCRVKYDSLNDFLEHLHETLPTSNDAKIWGDYVAFYYAIKRAFTIIAENIYRNIQISVVDISGNPTGAPLIEVGPRDAPYILITLIHTGNHFNVKFTEDWRQGITDTNSINITRILFENGRLDQYKIVEIYGEILSDIDRKRRLGNRTFKIIDRTSEDLSDGYVAKDKSNNEIRFADTVTCKTHFTTIQGPIKKLIKNKIKIKNIDNNNEETLEEVYVEIQTTPDGHTRMRTDNCEKIGSPLPAQADASGRVSHSPMPSGSASVDTTAVDSIFTPSIGAGPNYTGSGPWRGLPQVTGSESAEELLVKAANTLTTGAQLLLDLHTPQPRLPSVAVTPATVAGRIRGAAGAAAAGVSGALAAARRALGVPPAGRPQAPAAPAVPKPRLPPPSVAVRAPTSRRLPLTHPPPRRAVPALPVSLPAAAAAAAGVSGEEPPMPGWAPAAMDAGLRERCAAMPIPTDECAQFELDKDIRAVHDFIERHQLSNADPRMKDYIKDISSGKFSPADLVGKYPDHNIYVRAEGGRPVKMKVTNPYRAKSYRYQTEVSFADPTGADLSGDEKRLHKQNVDLLKAIAPASVIADKRFATAILESLWRCSASQDLAGKPACFPARVLGELRLFEKYHDQATRKQMADDVRVFSEWGMVSDIMRQMIRGEVPPVRADAAQAQEAAAAAAAAPQPAAAAAAAAAPQPAAAAAAPAPQPAAAAAAAGAAVGVSGEPVAQPAAAAAAAAAPKPPAGPLRPIRRGLAVRAPAQIGALGPRFQHGILPPTTIGAPSMVM